MEGVEFEQVRVELRNQILPAIKMYGVRDVEMSYCLGNSEPLFGMQFRDGGGRRIARTALPVALAERLEICLRALLPGRETDGFSGQGILSLCAVKEVIARRHQVIGGVQHDTVSVWHL
jgi:hypothetical protein